VSAGVTGVASDDAPDDDPLAILQQRVLFCTVNWTLSGLWLLCMDKLAGSIHEQVATMSHEEIVRRFKKLFGREMTSAERNNFFLPNQETTPPSVEE